MNLNNIKRNQLDYLLTDILPNELSDRFTYSHFYDYLIGRSDEVKQMYKQLEETKAKAEGMFQGKKCWASMPLKYSIMKELHTVREISLVQPLAAIEMLLFVGVYQKELLNLLDKNACFSLRYHHRNNDLCYKNKNKSVIRYFYEESKQAGREVIEQTGMFFNILPYKSISAFTSSEEWLVLNSKYAYFIKTDYKACFDSIYTHTYTWLIGKDSIDTKEFNHNSNIYSTIDRVLQNINARRSNGIVVGPEFSRMIAELMLQSIDVGVNSRLLNSGVICGQDYNVYRYVDDIFIFAKTEELANSIVEMYSELARKYLLRLNDSKLYRSKVPFVLEGWLIEANLFTNRICEMLFTTKEEQKVYVEREMQMENDDVRPYLLKSYIIRYGSKSKQSIMNQLNEIVCKYETKDRTLIAYFLSAILNHIGKNKDKVRIFKKEVSESTVFSFLDLVFYAYSFFPNYNNTQKLLSIISYVRDEYDIFSKSRSLQNLLNKYAFVFEKANLNDIVDLFLFCAQAKIEIPYVEEERIIKKLHEKDDPILWATYLLYSKYNEKYYNDIKTTIEQILAKRIEAIRVQKSIFEYREFWWVLVFNKCPVLSSTSQILINEVINSLPYTGTGNRNCADISLDVFVDYLKNNDEQFFEWDMSRKDFLRTITFKTHEKSIFKNYKESVVSLAWGSI